MDYGWTSIVIMLVGLMGYLLGLADGRSEAQPDPPRTVEQTGDYASGEWLKSKDVIDPTDNTPSMFVVGHRTTVANILGLGE